MSLARFSLIRDLLGLAVCGWVLASFYRYLGTVAPPGWLSIAILHTFVGLILWYRARSLRLQPVWGAKAFIPAALIAGGSLGLGLITRFAVPGAPAVDTRVAGSMLAFVVWIPVVEELVFRYGLGGWARQRLGPFWGAYASALVFAMAHGSASVPFGPFLLGLACEWLYVNSGRITAVMALHAACNASAWIFAAVDERWLRWLEALYLKV